MEPSEAFNLAGPFDDNCFPFYNDDEIMITYVAIFYNSLVTSVTHSKNLFCVET